MLSLSLGPIALPLAPFLLLIAIWGSSWLASRLARQGADKVSGEQAGRTVTHAALLGLVAARLAYLVWHADAYLASPWAAFDLRDGGWSAPAGLVAGMARLGHALAAQAAGGERHSGCRFLVAGNPGQRAGRYPQPAPRSTGPDRGCTGAQPHRGCARASSGGQSVGQLVRSLPGGNADAGGRSAARTYGGLSFRQPGRITRHGAKLPAETEFHPARCDAGQRILARTSHRISRPAHHSLL